MRAELVVRGISHLSTMTGGEDGLGVLEDASVAFVEGRVAYVGDAAGCPDADEVVEGKGLIGLPGLVDPHTHTVWAGSRSREFQVRLEGADYSEILEAGGGILSTVSATRTATPPQLRESAQARVDRMLAQGVTTVEIKSGYGLSAEAEAKMLQVATSLSGPRISPTFLGAHTIPASHRDKREAYIEDILERQLPLCAPLAHAIDVYCDRGAFTLEESIRILKAGKAHGLAIKAHAEQVVHTGIAAEAARLGATSVDHLEQLEDDDIAVLAAHNTVAVLLPGAQLYLKDPAPPVHQLREAGVKMAVGSDLNPGSSPVPDLWTAMTLATLLQGMTVPEVLRGVTTIAAQALGIEGLGRIEPGAIGDLALFRPPPGEPADPASLVQFMGPKPCVTAIRDGAVVHRQIVS